MISLILVLFLIWRLFLFFTAFWGSFILPFQPRFPYADGFLISSDLPAFVWSFANFDGVHYLTIARSGYAAQFTQVFFPLYPLLLSVFQKILYFINPLAISLIVTNLFFLAGLYLFNQLLRIDYKPKEISWMVLFLLLFPTSFYFAGLYTESLFLILILLCFYLARRKMWLLAAITAGLASSARLVGIFLLPALFWEYLQDKSNVRGQLLNVLKSPILYIAPLGLISYMIYLQINFGDALYFWHAQPIFGASREGSNIILLPQVLWRYFKILTKNPVDLSSFWIPLTELTSTIFAVILLILGHYQKIRLSYLIFSWLAILTPTLTGTFSSMPRYILVAFPIFISLGLIKSKLLKILSLVTFFLLLIIFTILFPRGIWVA